VQVVVSVFSGNVSPSFRPLFSGLFHMNHSMHRRVIGLPGWVTRCPLSDSDDFLYIDFTFRKFFSILKLFILTPSRNKVGLCSISKMCAVVGETPAYILCNSRIIDFILDIAVRQFVDFAGGSGLMPLRGCRHTQKEAHFARDADKIFHPFRAGNVLSNVSASGKFVLVIHWLLHDCIPPPCIPKNV